MTNLTEIQKNFILNAFFPTKELGWKNIATELLNSGNCIVPGDYCIWTGVIGNFIKTSKAPNFINCLLYEFDIDKFLSSDFYYSVRNERLSKLSKEIESRELEYDDLRLL